MESAIWVPVDDGSGYTYYYNTHTGESAWEVPATPEPPCLEAPNADNASATWQFGGTDETGAFYFVHAKTGERVHEVPPDPAEALTPDADSSVNNVVVDVALPDVEPDIVACMIDVVALVDKNLQPWLRRKERNAKAKKPRSSPKKRWSDRVQVANGERPELDAERRRDQVEMEVAKLEARYAARRTRLVQKAIAAERSRVRQFQIDLRQHMTRRLILRATNGIDVHGKIHLAVADTETAATLYENEERVAARAAATRALEQLFVAMDPRRARKLSALHILFCLATDQRATPLAKSRKGIDFLRTNSDIQGLFLALGVVSMDMFVYFVDVTEEISEHIEQLKAAIEDAGLGIVSPDVATWESSLSNVKTDETIQYPARRLILLNRLVRSFAQAKNGLLGQLQYLLPMAADLPAGTSLWEYNHKHVYIQLARNLPLYCCICRRNRFRLKKLQRYEDEEAYRKGWGRTLARRMASIELDLKATMDTAPRAPRPSPATGDPHTLRFTHRRDQPPVAALLDDLIAAIELLQRDVEGDLRRVQAGGGQHDHIFVADSKWLLHKLTRAREEIEREEYERSWLFEEDEASHEVLEALKVSVETPLERAQESGHKEFLRLSNACVLPSIYLQRLHYDRLLLSRPAAGQLVLRMYDRATDTFCVLHMLRCATSAEAASVVDQATRIERNLRDTFVVAVRHTFSCIYQHFATTGNLNECWPIAFVAVEDCERGEYLLSAPSLLPQSEVLSIMTTTAAALVSLHSQGVLHLNLAPSNLYRTHDGQLKVGGLLLFKTPFCPTDAAAGMLSPVLVPPEVDADPSAPTNDKTDMWALGCLLYHLVTGN
ncbi:protein kinase [Achlya hypogyna]|uniref:Protein kinase n=1 Tax=Achlya hypogyna TaxID=1202772 RepID=A0A1V9ZM70_ACHHY|nr:protein kinase [Achlya hypogyna]